MNKQEFLNRLERLLMSLPNHERERMKVYYDEIIEDYIENGFSEAEAVIKLGNVEVIAEEILNENKQPGVEKGTMSGSMNVGTIILIVLGSPLWGALLLASLAVLLAFYILLCVPVIVSGAFILSFCMAAIIAIVGTPFLFTESISMAVMQFGVGIGALGVVGLSIVLLYFSVKFIGKMTKLVFKIIASLLNLRRVRN